MSAHLSDRMAPRISAVVCTHNRSAYLAKALDSLVGQTLARPDYEVIVVDNASTDDTAATVRRFLDGATEITALHEAQPGLAHARNAALRVARAPYVAFLDDDAVASPTWLATLLGVFESVQPTPGCAGGRIDPIWEAARPSWLGDELLPYLAILDWSPLPGVLAEPRYLAGANVAFSRVALDQVGGFDAQLGRVGTRLLSNEEIAVERRLRRQGWTCYYHPAAAVAHHVPATRLQPSWFVQRFWWQGISDAVLEMLDDRRPAWRRLARALRRGILPGLRRWRPGGARALEPTRLRRHCEAMRDLAYGATLLRGPSMLG